MKKILFYQGSFRISTLKSSTLTPVRRIASQSVKMNHNLKITNTLQPGQPTAFVPIEAGKISWYSCGPTVYDHSHLGHARNYVSTDILRRILKHYFMYDVKFVQNITDIDDKIILKARRQRLLELEKAKPYSSEQIAKLASDAFQAYSQSSLPKLLDGPDPLTPENYAQRRDTAYGVVLSGGSLTGEKAGDNEAKLKMHLSNLTAATSAIQEQRVFGGADEILLPYLDSLYKESVDAKDHTIFTDVTKYWENDFMEDMEALNVLKPDVVTRVTEYVPQIVDFVAKIVEKGFAYEAEGSVYFDIASFERANNTYAKLRPDSKNDSSLLADGEGALSKGSSGKRGAGDFALWKASKLGEPSWSSPWGEGRPGWHIECSVMASDILGSRMDIHSGGVDLAFPHHDNELAQSEAYYCDCGKPHNWVNYFLHTGHLSISGSKMSKSLKNFQTIKHALNGPDSYTPRGMRVVFLMGRWNEGCEISPDLRTQAKVFEDTLNNFFTNVKSLVAEAKDLNLEDLSINDDSVYNALSTAEKEMKLALEDSFDTPKAMRVLSELVKEVNTQLGLQKSKVSIKQVEDAARFVTRIVGIFGLDASAEFPYNGLGWATSASARITDPQEAIKPYSSVLGTLRSEVQELAVKSDILDSLLAYDVEVEFASIVSTGANDIEALSIPYLRAVSKIRDELRKLAPSSASKKEILSISDRIRDSDLTNLGVYLDDRPDNQPSLIKFVPTAELVAVREEKANKEREKLAAKEVQRAAREKLEAEKVKKAKINPTEMFRGDQKYEAWDAEGMPTKLKGGEEVPKSQTKKLRKEWEKQKKLFDEFSAKN